MSDISNNNDQNARGLYRAVGSDWLMDKADPAYTQALLDLLHPYIITGRKVLDLCCGYGRLTIPLLNAGYDVTGIDISDVLIDQGTVLSKKHGVSGQPFIIANMKELPFQEGVFDFCFCIWASFNFLMTEAEQFESLGEMHRVLKKYGTALIEIPLHENPEAVQRITVENVSYLYCPITVTEMKNLAVKSPFTLYDLAVESIAGRDRVLCRLFK